MVSVRIHNKLFICQTQFHFDIQNRYRNAERPIKDSNYCYHILSSALIITVVVVIWNYKRRSAKHTNSSYSTLSRGTGQQTQPQSIQQNSAGLYDQIHLSPFSGQNEFISKPESANIIQHHRILIPSLDLRSSHE